MSTMKTLNIVNYFPNAIDVAVTDQNWNCCDQPQRGQNIGQIASVGSTSFTYVRTDGHGCNGRQGQFQLSFESNFLLNMDFDGNGDIEISAVPTTFGAFLSGNPDGNYTLVVGPEPHH